MVSGHAKECGMFVIKEKKYQVTYYVKLWQQLPHLVMRVTNPCV